MRVYKKISGSDQDQRRQGNHNGSTNNRGRRDHNGGIDEAGDKQFVSAPPPAVNSPPRGSCADGGVGQTKAEATTMEAPTQQGDRQPNPAPPPDANVPQCGSLADGGGADNVKGDNHPGSANDRGGSSNSGITPRDTRGRPANGVTRNIDTHSSPANNRHTCTDMNGTSTSSRGSRDGDGHDRVSHSNSADNSDTHVGSRHTGSIGGNARTKSCQIESQQDRSGGPALDLT